MRSTTLLILVVASSLSLVGAAGIGDGIDAALLAEIGRIRAIDHHSHDAPAAPPPDAEPQDPIGRPPFPYPVRLRMDNPEYADAWRALWQVPPGPGQPAAALRAKWQARRDRGEAYPAWVLDQAGIDTAVVIADRLGPGQAPPRFRFVPMADELLSPTRTDRGRLRQLLTDVGVGELPSSVDAFASQVMTPTLERWHSAGAIGIKLAVAYRRPLDFGPASKADAERVYANLTTGSPAATEQKLLQDYLFRLLCREAGRIGLAVHIHTGIGSDPYFHVAGSRPSLLEPALNDAALRQTRIVLVHGGWPFDAEAGVMLIKPNVYADFSAQPFLRSTRALAGTLRAWLEWYPEKILFGTDAYPEGKDGLATPLAGWEEKAWLATRTSREALALALTGMMADGQITRARAIELARMVLRGNAERLYVWNSPR